MDGLMVGLWRYFEVGLLELGILIGYSRQIDEPALVSKVPFCGMFGQ